MRAKVLLTSTAVAGLLALAPSTALASTMSGTDLTAVSCGHTACSSSSDKGDQSKPKMTVAKSEDRGTGDDKASGADKGKGDDRKATAAKADDEDSSTSDVDTDTDNDEDKAADTDTDEATEANEAAEVEGTAAENDTAELGAQSSSSTAASTATPSSSAATSTTTPGATTANVLGFQANNTPANGTNTMPGAVNGTQSNVGVLGVETLPSTSTAEVANLAGTRLALLSAGGGVLMIRRRRK